MQVRFHTGAFTQRCFAQVFHTLIRLHRAFAYKFFYKEILLHASAFTQTYFETQWQVLLHNCLDVLTQTYF